MYYLPTWFQCVQGVDSAQSGIRLLPTIISTILGTVIGGFIKARTGYYTSLAFFGSSITGLGAVLITYFGTDMPNNKSKWIGYQVIYGIGTGLCSQVLNVVVWSDLPKADQAIGLSLMQFCNLLSSTVFVSVGSNGLINQLLYRLDEIPGFEPGLVISGGATSLVDALPSASRPVVLKAYDESLHNVFAIAGLLCSISSLGCAVLEWKYIKKGWDMGTSEASAEARQWGTNGPSEGEEMVDR